MYQDQCKEIVNGVMYVEVWIILFLS